MQVDVKFSVSDYKLTATIPCEIDHHTAKSIRESIDRKLVAERPELLILDFSRVGFMDSSGIGLIMGRCQLAAELGARVRVRGLSTGLLRLVQLSGIEKINNLSIG